MTVAELDELMVGVRSDLLGRCGVDDERGMVVGVSSSDAWALALSRTPLSAGDRVVLTRAGEHSARWAAMAGALGYDVVCIDVPAGQGPSGDELTCLLWWDPSIKAVFVAQDETSAGVVADVAELRRAIDLSGSEALFLVDCVATEAGGTPQQRTWSADLVVTALPATSEHAATLVNWSPRLPDLAGLPAYAAPPTDDALRRIRSQLDHPATTRHIARAGRRVAVGASRAAAVSRSLFGSRR